MPPIPNRHANFAYLPTDIWLNVFKWLDVKHAVAFINSHYNARQQRDAFCWTTLVLNDTRLWSSSVQKRIKQLALQHAQDSYSGYTWTYTQAAAVYSSLLFQRLRPSQFTPFSSCVPVESHSNQLTGDVVTTIHTIGDKFCVTTPRGICMWDSTDSTIEWHDFAQMDDTLFQDANYTSIRCAFTAALPWELPADSDDDVNTLTEWASAPYQPTQVHVQLNSIVGEPEDMVGLTNYRQYFRMKIDPDTGKYTTQELLLGCGFEASVSSPQLLYYTYPYLVISGYYVLPPVTYAAVSTKVFGVWNIETAQPVFRNETITSEFNPYVCTAMNESGTCIYWIDDAREMHKRCLNDPFRPDPNYPKKLPSNCLTRVSDLAVSEVKSVVALYSQTTWMLYDLHTMESIRAITLRHTCLQFYPWKNIMLLTRRIGEKILVQKVRIGSDVFFLSSEDN